MRNLDGTTSGAWRPKNSRRWPLIIVGLLAVHVTLMLTAAAIATRDRSFAVLPNYYENAVNWDKTRAAMESSRELGWKLQINPAAAIDPHGSRQVAILLTDAQGQPIPNAKLDLTYYHHAHANEAASVTLSATEPGRFATNLPMRYDGFWQFKAKVEAGGKTFVTDLSQFVGEKGKP
jgi:nitrogen fixation protein FixH